MQAIHINPFTKTVTVVDHNGSLERFYELLNCDCMTVAYADNMPAGDVIYVDDEGLLKDLTQQAFFMIEGFPQPLTGHGLVLGTDDSGESITPTITAEEVAKRVTWMNLLEVRDYARKHGI